MRIPPSANTPASDSERESLDEVLFADGACYSAPAVLDEVAQTTLDAGCAPPPGSHVSPNYHCTIEPSPEILGDDGARPAVRDGDNEYRLTGLAPGLFELQAVSAPVAESLSVVEDPISPAVTVESASEAPDAPAQDTLPEPTNDTADEPPPGDSFAQADEQPMQEEQVEDASLPLAGTAEEPQQAAPPREPCVLEVNAPVELIEGQTVTLSEAFLRIAGPSPENINYMILSPVECGTLLRNGLAMTGGDIFTQDDINTGKIQYRSRGAGAGGDSFTFAMSDGELGPVVFSFTIHPAHHAPELLGPGQLDGIVNGSLVCDILDSAANCHDPDQPAGLALVGIAGRGKWEYSLDGMRTWLELTGAQHSLALLLCETDAIRFVPRPGWSGAVKLTYRAWDQSTGLAGETVNLAGRDTTGGTTAFSRTTASATFHIAAPLPETPAAGPWEGTPTMGELAGDGLAVVRLEGEGTWQYSLDDGRSWQDFGKVYHGRARLLGSGDRVRFLPRQDAKGKVILGGRLWDGRGTAGGTAALGSKRDYGEGTPFGEFVLTRTWWLSGD